MRLLFDQNISYRVVKQLKSLLPEIIGVREVSLLNADDYEIWEYCRQNDYTIITFDKDLPTIGSVKGYPPKIIWLRTGNLSNQAIASLFTERIAQFSDFISNHNEGCLMVYLPFTTDFNLTNE